MYNTGHYLARSVKTQQELNPNDSFGRGAEGFDGCDAADQKECCHLKAAFLKNQESAFVVVHVHL